MSESRVEGKTNLRRTVRRARRQRLQDRGDSVEQDGLRIAEHVMDLEDVQHACEHGLPVTCYVSRDEEPPTDQLREQLLAAGAVLLLPRVDGEDLQWIPVTSDSQWDTNLWNIREPAGPPFDGSPAVWIIPGLAIDSDGYRLGQGGGYYDRALAAVHDEASIIAIVFEEEVLDEVPREDHDHRVDIVVTPDRVRWLSMPD